MEPTAGAAMGSGVSSLSRCSTPSRRVSIVRVLLSAAAARFSLQRLRHDRDIRNARLLYRIHHAGKGSERHALVAAQVDGLICLIHAGMMQRLGQIVNVDGLIVEEDLLV